VRALPASEALDYLFTLRNIAAARKYVRREYRPQFHPVVQVHPVVKRLLEPTHPVLIGSALTLFRLRLWPKAEATLAAFISGLDVPDLDAYIDYPGALPPGEATAALDAESRHRQVNLNARAKRRFSGYRRLQAAS
jgi:hypothetical protein